MITRVSFFFIFCLLLSIFNSVHGYNRYSVGEDISVWVDRVGPFNNPQEYYMYHNLPFCRPSESKGKLEGLGESFAGYELRTSSISISFAVPTRSGLICDKTLTFDEASLFAFAVENQYWYQMFIDDIPVWGLIGEVVESDDKRMLYMYSHIHFDISKNNDRVIDASLTSEGAVLIQDGASISFTYSVSWTNTQDTSEHRFEKYLDTSFFEHQIHWFSLFNSLMLLIFLFGLVGMILLRTLRKEYILGEDELEDDIGDDNAGWKLLHRDIFRSPPKLLLFSSLIGIGYQLIASTLLVLVLGYLGAHYYESRGSIISAFIAWYIICSAVGGYTSGSVFSKNQGTSWIKNVIFNVLSYPLVLLLVVISSNFITHMFGALSFVPFGTIILSGILVTVCGFPIAMVGTFFGRHLGKKQHKFNINQVPRMIPVKPWYLSNWGIMLWSGALPFSTIFVEMFFIYSSLFHYKFYYVYGFATIVFLLLLLVTMAVSIISTYFLLNSEDHKWHWNSFRTGFSVSFYYMLYAIYYYLYRTNMDGFLQFTHFFAMNIGIAFSLGLICSSISYFAANKFIQRIYRGLKAE